MSAGGVTFICVDSARQLTRTGLTSSSLVKKKTYWSNYCWILGNCVETI